MGQAATRSAALIISALLAVACSDDSAGQVDSRTNPKDAAPGADAAPPAAYKIGHIHEDYVDTARSNRKVPTEIYYPADSKGEKVPLAAGAPKSGFPVVVFGHGRKGPVSAYENYWQALVPRGFIVALPATEGGLTPDHAAFNKDLHFVAKQLQDASAKAGSPFAGKVSSRAAVMGHSMGGAVSLLAAASSTSKFAAVALFAPGKTQSPSSMSAAGLITIPALVFAGSDDKLTPPAQYAEPYYAALKSQEKLLVTLTGGSHCQFSKPEHSCDTMEAQKGTPSLSRHKQHALTSELLVPWATAALTGDSKAAAELTALLKSSQAFTYKQN